MRTQPEGSLRALAALWIWNAYGDLMHSVRTGEPAFEAVLRQSAGLRMTRTLSTASPQSLIEATR